MSGLLPSSQNMLFFPPKAQHLFRKIISNSPDLEVLLQWKKWLCVFLHLLHNIARHVLYLHYIYVHSVPYIKVGWIKRREKAHSVKKYGQIISVKTIGQAY